VFVVVVVKTETLASFQAAAVVPSVPQTTKTQVGFASGCGRWL